MIIGRRVRVIGLLVLVMGAAAQAQTKPTTRLRPNYTNEAHHLRFTYPVTAMVKGKSAAEGEVVIFQVKSPPDEPVDTLGRVQLLAMEGKGGALKPQQLNDVVESVKQDVANGKGKLVGTEKTTLGGSDAVAVRFVADLLGNGTQMEVKQIVAIRNGKAYILGFAASEGKLDAMMKRVGMVAETFEWTAESQ